jgi:hypothetical protein
LALQFIHPHKSRSLYSFLLSWWAFTHQRWCQRVDSFIQSMIMVTMSTSLLYQGWWECLCCVQFTHDIDTLLSTHFMHLLVDSILWNFMK